MKIFDSIFNYLKNLINRIIIDDFLGMAAEMGFWFAIGIFPFMLFMMSFFTMLGKKSLFMPIMHFLDSVAPTDSVNLIKEVYQKDFGFSESSFQYRLSLRDKANKEKYIDNDEMWETAESQLRDILKELNIDFYEAEGEAAFYGPKIDIQIKTALNHDVTIPTCQLDFALPERFELEYIGEDGKAHRPVVIHRAI